MTLFPDVYHRIHSNTHRIHIVQGVEAVKKAVKESWDAGVFMVFLIIDKQRGSESILDVRTPSNIYFFLSLTIASVIRCYFYYPVFYYLVL